MKNKLTIIIATRNRNELLDKTLYSLTLQKFNKFEVIVCNEGGNKDTKYVVNNYQKFLDIKYYYCKDLGTFCPSQARNLGAEKSSTEYLFFLDDDIIMPHDAVGLMYKKYKLLFFNNYFIVPQQRVYINYNVPKFIIKDNYKKLAEYSINYSGGVSISCASLIKKELFNKVGGFDQILFRGLQLEDTDLTKRLEGFLNIKKKVVPFNVYHLDNNPFRNNRDIKAVQRKIIAKQIIMEKLIMMGFKIISFNHTPRKENSTLKLIDKEEINNISKILYRRYKLYDHPTNYHKFNINFQN